MEISNDNRNDSKKIEEQVTLFAVQYDKYLICQTDGCANKDKIYKTMSSKKFILYDDDALSLHGLKSDISFRSVHDLINNLFNSYFLPIPDDLNLTEAQKTKRKCNCCGYHKYRKCVITNYPYVLAISLHYTYTTFKNRVKTVKYRKIVEKIEKHLEFEEGQIKYTLQAICLHSSNGHGHFLAKIWNRFNNQNIPIYTYDGCCSNGKFNEDHEDKQLDDDKWYNINFQANIDANDNHITPEFLLYTMNT
jgi:hypothetical protein